MWNFKLINKNRVVLIHDLFVALFALPLAYWVRSNFDAYPLTSEMLGVFCLVSLVKAGTFWSLKLQKGIWRFASILDLLLIIRATVVSTFIYVFTLFFLNRVELLPRSVIILDSLFTLLMLGAGRFSYRVYKDYFRRLDKGKRVLIIGAGKAGEQLVREIQKNLSFKYEIVGLLDDDPDKINRRIHQVPVLGKSSELLAYFRSTGAEEVLIAIPSASSKFIREVTDVCIEHKISVLTLPGLKDVVDGRVSLSSLRPINIEDLLGRQKVELSSEKLLSHLNGKVVLVTGAGGSIGSELCVQVASFGPQLLVLYEQSEFALYNIERKLNRNFPNVKVIPFLGDVKNPSRTREVIVKYRPSVVFHAAAYKHVPLIESNPSEAVYNNIGGTKVLASICSDEKVDRFVLVSTDKAVNPTNVMGATKRVAEKVCQYYQNARGNETVFSVVRFGNVLGSAGSVVPLFLEQIKSGGPVTVTHPEITRYFMSIPEACQLVLEAGTLGKGGEIFVLDMGESVKITRLATDLINLSGLKVGEDIKIEFTGLRPGEKLYEELLSDKETTLPTAHEKVRVAAARELSVNDINMIQELIEETCVNKQLSLICNLVPEYQSTNEKLWC